MTEEIPMIKCKKCGIAAEITWSVTSAKLFATFSCDCEWIMSGVEYLDFLEQLDVIFRYIQKNRRYP